MLLIDATTAQHARGMQTVIVGILRELHQVAPARTVVTTGPDLEPLEGLSLLRVVLAKTRPGRLLYQRLLLPFHVYALAGARDPIDRVLLLDAYVPLVRPQRSVRYAAFVHDVLPLTQPHFWPPAKRAVKRLAFSSLRRSEATLFTSSEHNAREIRRVLGADARVISYGCGQLSDAEAEEARAAPLPEREPYVVYVGAVEPRKDVLSLLDAFELAAGSLDIGLTIVGDGPASYAAAVRAKVAQSRHRDRIRFLPRADRETTLRLLSKAGALVFPTLAEGFGLPILEALALGTPVVVSDLPEIRTWAGEAVLYAPPARPAEWVEPIEAALAADVTRRRAAQGVATHFRWRNIAQDIVDF